MLPVAPLGGGVFLGWALGANDAANVFGTAVASRIISFRKAAFLCAAAVVLGAVLQGQAGIHTLGKLTQQTQVTLLITSLAAGMTVTLMTFFRIPVSTSQAIIGAIAGLSLATRQTDSLVADLTKIIVCWIATPVAAMVIAGVVYHLIGLIVMRIPMSMLTRDKILWSGLLIVGIYGSYALGANNVANATGIFSGRIEGVTDTHLALLGGLAIAAGVISYSKRVMLAVGSGLMRLDAFTALVAVSAMSVTVHAFAVVGVPVSTSQGIVGAIIGISITQRVWAVQARVLCNMGLGWILTPFMALMLAAAGYAIFV